MPVRRSELAEWRREQILDAALEVFGNKGVDAATMKDVAAAAGVTPGLLYHYFDSKEALSLAVTADRGFLAELRELLTDSANRPADEVLAEVATGFDRILSERVALVSLFMSGVGNPTIKAGLDEILQATQQALGDYLAARVEVGELRPHDSYTLVVLLFNACAFGHLVGEPVNPRAVADIVLHGVAVER